MPCFSNLFMSFSIIDFINENYVWRLFMMAKHGTVLHCSTLYRQQKEKILSLEVLTL